MAFSTARLIDILHVDDDPDFVEMAATLLERRDNRFSIEAATRVESPDSGPNQPKNCLIYPCYLVE